MGITLGKRSKKMNEGQTLFLTIFLLISITVFLNGCTDFFIRIT